MAEPVSDTNTVNSQTPQLPYRWGYFQGILLIPFSLLLMLGVVGEQMHPDHEPWFIAAMLLLICIVGVPLGIGLLMKKRFALTLVYVICGLTFLLTCMKVPYAVVHFSSRGGGSAFFEAELLLVWLFSFVYYRRRRSMFN